MLLFSRGKKFSFGINVGNLILSHVNQIADLGKSYQMLSFRKENQTEFIKVLGQVVFPFLCALGLSGKVLVGGWLQGGFL